MSTDTPRTTERLWLLENEHDDVAFESLSDFARQLERELAALLSARNEDEVTILLLRARVAELEQWKESALAVEREWDEQQIARLLGGTTGQSCRKIIQKRVPEILSALAQAEALLRDWIVGGECFCCAEGVAARGPCEYCRTNGYFAAQKGEAQ